VIKLKLQNKSFDDNFSIMINLLSHNLEVHKCDQRLLSMIKSKHLGGGLIEESKSWALQIAQDRYDVQRGGNILQDGFEMAHRVRGRGLDSCGRARRRR
jgi:hypothetical protein